MPSGGVPSTFFAPTSFQLVDSTVPFDSTCRWWTEQLVIGLQKKLTSQRLKQYTAIRKTGIQLLMECLTNIPLYKQKSEEKSKSLQRISASPFLCLHQHLDICPGKTCSEQHHHPVFHLFPVAWNKAYVNDFVAVYLVCTINTAVYKSEFMTPQVAAFTYSQRDLIFLEHRKHVNSFSKFSSLLMHHPFPSFFSLDNVSTPRLPPTPPQPQKWIYGFASTTYTLTNRRYSGISIFL